MNRTFPIAACLLLGVPACSGALEQRIGVLEEQVLELQTETAGPTQVEEKLSAIEASTSDTMMELRDSIQVLESRMGKGNTRAAPVAKTNGHATSNVDYQIRAALGVANAGVAVEDGTYTVQRSWLMNQVRNLASARDIPKLAVVKDHVVVRRVKPKSLAASLGLKNRDVILKIGDEDVSSVEGVATALNNLSGPTTTITLERKKKQITLQYVLAN